MNFGIGEQGKNEPPAPAGQVTGQGTPPAPTIPPPKKNPLTVNDIPRMEYGAVQKAIKLLEARPNLTDDQKRLLVHLRFREGVLRPIGDGPPGGPKQKLNWPFVIGQEPPPQHQYLDLLNPLTYTRVFRDYALSLGRGEVDLEGGDIARGLPLVPLVGTWPARVLNIIFPTGPTNTIGDLISPTPAPDPAQINALLKLWADVVAVAGGVVMSSPWRADPPIPTPSTEERQEESDDGSSLLSDPGRGLAGISRVDDLGRRDGSASDGVDFVP